MKLDYRIIGTFVRTWFPVYFPKEQIDFQSIDETEHFCQWKFNKTMIRVWVCNEATQSTECGHSQYCKSIDDFIGGLHYSFDTPVIVSATTQSPLWLTKLSMEFTFHQHSESWVDVMISKTRNKEQTSNFGFESLYLFDIISLVPDRVDFFVTSFSDNADSMVLFVLEAKESVISELSENRLQILVMTEMNTFYKNYIYLTYPMSFWELIDGKIISLQGKIETIIFTVEQPISENISAEVKMIWLHDNYIKYSKHSKEFWTKASLYHKDTFSSLGYLPGVNISSSYSNRHYIFHSTEFDLVGFKRRQFPLKHTVPRKSEKFRQEGYFAYEDIVWHVRW